MLAIEQDLRYWQQQKNGKEMGSSKYLKILNKNTHCNYAKQILLLESLPMSFSVK